MGSKVKAMEQYIELKKEREVINHKLRERRGILNKQFIKQYRGWVWLVDMIILAAFIFNVGALVTTNMLVMKDVPKQDIVVYETNPVAAELHNYETVPEAKFQYLGFISYTLSWVFLLGVYYILRLKITSMHGFALLVILAIYIFTLTSFDFFNNLGILLGVKFLAIG